LAAGLCPDPLGELQHSPRTTSHYKGDGRDGGKGKERVENKEGKMVI